MTGEPQGEAVRQPYAAPRLRRIGSIADVTKATGTIPGQSAYQPSPNGNTTIYGNYSSGDVGSIIQRPDQGGGK